MRVMGQEKNQKVSSNKNSEKKTCKMKMFVKNCLKAIRNEINNTPLAILLGVLALIVSVVNLRPTVEVSEGINIDYLRQQEMDVDNPYMLFRDDISEKNQHLLVNECATVISVTNNYNEDVEIKEITFEALEITADDKPYLNVIMYTDIEGSVYLQVKNNGKEDAKNIILFFEEIQGNLEQYVGREKMKVEIPLVKASEEVNIMYLEKGEIKTGQQEPEIVQLKVDCYDTQGEKIAITSYGILMQIEENAISFLGKGGDGEVVYGIEIDTSKNEFVYTENISEIVKSGEIKRLPICFYPDTSCNMKFRVTLKMTHRNKERIITSDERELAFSIADEEDTRIEYYDAKSYSADEMVNAMGIIEDAIPFPYNRE